MDMGGQRRAPALHPRERPGIHCIGGWVGPRAGLDRCGISRPPPPGFDTRTVQPVTSRYTERATGPAIKTILTIMGKKCMKVQFTTRARVSLFQHVTTK